MQLKIGVETWLPFKCQAPLPHAWKEVAKSLVFHKKIGIHLGYNKFHTKVFIQSLYPKDLLKILAFLPPCSICLALVRCVLVALYCTSITAQYCGCYGRTGKARVDFYTQR